MQPPVGLAKDNRTQSEVGTRRDGQRHGWPKQQCAPRPKPNDQTGEGQRGGGVVETDAPILDYRKFRRGLANEVDAVDAEREAGDDVHEVVLVGEKSRETNEEKPDIRRVSLEAAGVASVMLSQNCSEGDV